VAGTLTLSARARASASSVIDDLFRLTRSRPDVVSFAAGAPDTSLLPVELLGDLTRAAVDRHGRVVLQYGDTQGFPPLREAVLPLLARRGLDCTVDDVHISTGGSGALNNLCMALLDEGDVVAVERPTYSPALRVFASYGARVVDVPGDADGLHPDALDACLARRPVRFLYAMPTFQNPTGRTMPAERRAAVAEVLDRHGTLLVEDDVYFDLRYRGEHLPALSALRPGRSVYLGSFSKLLAPALRTGYAVLPRPLLDGVLRLKQGIDMQTSSLTQALVAESLTGGRADRHLGVLRAVYQRKLGLLRDAVARHLPPSFTTNDPDGGMFLWLTAPAGVDLTVLLEAAVRGGVAYVPGSTFHADEAAAPRNTARLAFADVPEERIDEGARRLARVLGG
jgi:2-aminoadipate transaminase